MLEDKIFKKRFFKVLIGKPMYKKLTSFIKALKQLKLVFTSKPEISFLLYIYNFFEKLCQNAFEMF